MGRPLDGERGEWGSGWSWRAHWWCSAHCSRPAGQPLLQSYPHGSSALSTATGTSGTASPSSTATSCTKCSLVTTAWPACGCQQNVCLKHPPRKGSQSTRLLAVKAAKPCSAEVWAASSRWGLPQHRHCHIAAVTEGPGQAGGQHCQGAE